MRPDPSYVPEALRRAEARIARAFTGTYGPHRPAHPEPQYQGERYVHPLLGDLTMWRDTLREVREEPCPCCDSWSHRDDDGNICTACNGTGNLEFWAEPIEEEDVWRFDGEARP